MSTGTGIFLIGIVLFVWLLYRIMKSEKNVEDIFTEHDAEEFYRNK